LVLCLHSLAQKRDSSFTLIKTYNGDIADAVIDNLDNLYILSSTGQLKKFNANGDSVAVYNQVRNFGKLSSLDVSNPLKPLLFYKDFSTVVVLDRLLANRARLDLKKFGVFQPGAIALSYDNNIWVFDEYDNKLKKIDEQGNKLLETSDFRSIFNHPISPQKIINDNNLVYLADTAQGVFVFDNYGTYKKKISIKNWNSLEIANGAIIRTGKDEIILYNPSTFADASRKIPASFQPFIHSFTSSNRLVTFTNNSLRIYRFRF
jgi:DNA-binding beta-propeller fold protein YncE